MSEPLVPVTVTVKPPVVDPEIVRVEVPGPDTLVGLNVFDKPPPEAVALKVIVPVNAFDAVRVIVDVPLLPALKVTVVGEAEIAKSLTT